jgi:secretion monitor
MVAASFGLPALSNSTKRVAAKTTSSNHIPNKVNFSSWRCWTPVVGPIYRRLLASARHPHGYSSSLFCDGAAGAAGCGRVFALQAQHLALLDTLSALLTQESKPPVIVRQAAYTPSHSAFSRLGLD